eukprot:5820682-Amphidinium_carterae.1
MAVRPDLLVRFTIAQFTDAVGTQGPPKGSDKKGENNKGKKGGEGKGKGKIESGKGETKTPG